jgi:hypothetical protein
MLHLAMPLLNHLLHALPRLLQIIRQHRLLELELSQPLIVRLARDLDLLVSFLGGLLRCVEGGLARVARGWGDGDGDCEGRVRVRLLWGEVVVGGGDGGGYWFEVLGAVLGLRSRVVLLSARTSQLNVEIGSRNGNEDRKNLHPPPLT